MAERQFKSVHRKFTPEEKRLFEEGKRWAEQNKARLTREALATKAEIDAAHQTMRLLKAEREKRGLSLDVIAERSGIDKARLSKLETDITANPTFRTVTRIAKAIGVELTIQVKPAA